MKPADLALRQRCRRMGKGLLALVSVLAILTFSASGDYAWKPVARDKYGRTIGREKKR
jgi:hypothetical protein